MIVYPGFLYRSHNSYLDFEAPFVGSKLKIRPEIQSQEFCSSSESGLALNSN